MANTRVPIGSYMVPSPQGIYTFRHLVGIEDNIGMAYGAAPGSIPPPPTGGNNGIINTSGDLTKNVVRVFI